MKHQRHGESGHRKLLRILMWVFCLSFVLDFRGESGGPPVQMAFLAIAVLSGTWIILSNVSCLMVRPGAFLILLWWGYLASTVIVALAADVEPGRYLRVALPFILCGMGLGVAQVCAVRGIRIEELVSAILTCVVVNIVWRAAYGFVFGGVNLETVRVEILSPGLNWLMAYIGCGLLLRRRISPWLFAWIGIAGAVVFMSVTRGTLLPPMASAAATSFCLLIAVLCGVIPGSAAATRIARISAVVALVVLLAGSVMMMQPGIVERWEDRLFHHAGDVTSKDVSWLTREAEALGIWTSLSEEPLSFLYGKGMGNSYFWDSSYFPEIYLVYGEDEDFNGEIWFAGHSTWTFAFFSGGALGVLCCLGFFAALAALTLRSVHLNARLPGFRVDLAFLPLVAAFCLLSESITSNPFDERLSGLVFGLMAGLPQFLFVRAYGHRGFHQEAMMRVRRRLGGMPASAPSPLLPGTAPAGPAPYQP